MVVSLTAQKSEIISLVQHLSCIYIYVMFMSLTFTVPHTV